MTIKYLTPIDLTKQELQNARIQNLASAPGTPVKGLFYFDTTSNHLFTYNGSGWEQASGAAGSGTVTSVIVTTPSAILTVSGAGTQTITTSGTFALAFASQAANLVFAGPTSASAVPSFRALVAADIPTLTAVKISDFDTQVRTSRLDQMAAPTAAVALNAQKITGLADGTAATDAATFGQLNSLSEGKYWKDPVVAIATTNITLSGTQTIDGVAVVAGDRVLAAGQTTAANSGIYVVAAGAWARSADASTAAEVTKGATVLVTRGTTGLGDVYTQANAITTIGTDAQSWTKTGEGNTVYAADGTSLTLTGTTFSINTSWVGQAAITTLGTITTGTWSATTIALNKGGTGSTTAAGARTNLGATGVYTALIGDGAATSIAVAQATHGLAATGALLAMVYDASTGAQVFPDVSVNNSTGAVTFAFTTAPATNAYRIVIIG